MNKYLNINFCHASKTYKFTLSRQASKILTTMQENLFFDFALFYVVKGGLFVLKSFSKFNCG